MKKKALCLCGISILLFIAGPAVSDEIHLKDGRVLKVAECWEEKGMIKYRKYGTVLGIDKGNVKEVVRFSDFEKLEKDLESLNDEKRLEAVVVLGDTNDERAVAPLIGLLNDSNTEIRAAAEESLGKLGPTALDGLTGALNSSVSIVRTTSAKLLLNLDENKIVDPLVGALKREDLEVTAVVYKFILHKNVPGMEDTLLKTLKKYGTSEMAKDFVNSGNPKLAEAGLIWR